MECIFTCPTCGNEIVWDNQIDKKEPDCPQCPKEEEEFDSHSNEVRALWDQIDEARAAGDLRRSARCFLDILRFQPIPEQCAWQNLLMPERADLSGVPEDLLKELPEAFSGSSSAEERARRIQLVDRIQKYVDQESNDHASGEGIRSADAQTEKRSEPPETISVMAESLAEARKKARLQTPEGFHWDSLRIESDGGQRTIKENGKTTKNAFMKAEQRLPEGAEILSKTEIASPWRKSITIEAETESLCRSYAKSQSDADATILSVKLVTPGRKGFLGIGKTINQYEVEMFKEATVKITYREKVKITVNTALTNRGTRQDTFEMAKAYWMSRMSLKRKDPYVLYVFENESDAKNALLEFPCIQEDKNGNLACSELFTFGYYPRETDGKPDGKFEAIICGDDLTIEQWERAKSSFEKHNGRLEPGKELKPEKHADDSKDVKPPKPDEVVFSQEESGQGSSVTYRVHKGPDAASALAFLDENPVDKASYHIVVETPDGVYCRDINGFYKE